MLHELIMCLLGYVGGLFQLKIENNKSKIKLVENLDYLHPGEVEICNKLAELGNFYRQIIGFYDTYCFGKPIENKPLKDGMYLRAFCDAIDSVVLAPYRQVISNLEKDLLKDRYNNVTYLQTHLENYFCIFSALENVVNEITSKKLHGCQILDLIYKHTISGNSEVKSTFNEILTKNLNVMYKQLRDWMLYGNLYDKYGEFFICTMDNTTSGSRSSSTSNLAALSQPQQTTGDNDNIDLEDAFLLGDRFTSSFTQYSLNSTQLPTFISLKTANKILFNGELLQLFKSASDELLLDNSISDQFSMLNFSISGIQKNNTSNKLPNEEFNLINKNMDELSKKIWSLSKEDYSNVKFDNLVTEIRNYASEAVWHLIVEKYNLLDEFQKLKDMYLIGRGELFATFLEASKSMLNKQVDHNFEYNINFMFQKSISRMLLDNESWLSKFRIVLTEQRDTEKKNQTGWNRIGLSYRVEWPFNSLITKRVLNKYNEIFNHLLSIRRVQIELNQCFLLRMRLNGKILTQTIDPKVWQTRNHMSFIIDNLQFYLQADVLETRFDELETRVKNSKDFEQIRYAHDSFLTRIQYHSFMTNKTILVYLNSIMDLCLGFCSILLNYEDEVNLKKNKDSLQEITKNFQIQTSSLYKALRSIEKKQLGTHLEQLLTRINFNNYMEEHEGYL